MTYNEVRGTGLAAVCPIIEEGTTNLSDIKPGSYKLQQLCLEPTKIWVSAGAAVSSSRRMMHLAASADCIACTTLVEGLRRFASMRGLIRWRPHVAHKIGICVPLSLLIALEADSAGPSAWIMQ